MTPFVATVHGRVMKFERAPAVVSVRASDRIPVRIRCASVCPSEFSEHRWFWGHLPQSNTTTDLNVWCRRDSTGK